MLQDGCFKTSKESILRRCWSTTWTGIRCTCTSYWENCNYNFALKIVPAATHVGADLLEFAVPENAEVVSGRKILKTAAKCVGRQTLRKQLGSGSRKRSASRVIPTKSAK